MCVVRVEWGRQFVCRLVGSHKGEFKFGISGYSHFHLFATPTHTHTLTHALTHARKICHSNELKSCQIETEIEAKIECECECEVKIVLELQQDKLWAAGPEKSRSRMGRSRLVASTNSPAA